MIPAIGSLMYAMVSIGPYIAHAKRTVRIFMDNLGRYQWQVDLQLFERNPRRA